MIALSIRRPVAVTVGVLLVALFGFLSLLRVPVQLTPDIVKPEITVETRWIGASPHEVERNIVEEQEEQLKGVEDVERLTSESFDSLGRIVLRFPPGTDMDAALIKVSNRLEQVPEYPDDADKPVISTTNKTDNAMAWFMLYRLPGNDTPIDHYYRLAEDEIKPELEKVRGVGASYVYGGREEELHVIVRPEDLATRGITISQVIEALDRENTNVSAGDFSEGKRKYTVRTVGEYSQPEDVEKVVLETKGGKRVYLSDVADVRIGMKKRDNFVRLRGVPTIALNCVRRIGTNVLDTMKSVQATVKVVNERLKDRGLHLVQVYDETDYISDSINRVLKNLLLGSFLATGILFLFLRSVVSTLIIAISIPVSIIGSFVLMYFFGRTVNVISLAGMSFASGMVVDNAIVSLENIYRLRQAGKGRIEAAHEGAQGVWGAIFASTLTTIAVFLPVLFVEAKVGQLFRDIAIAISCSVGLSLIVSITVIPSMSAALLTRVRERRGETWVGPFGWLGRLLVNSVSVLTRRVWLQIPVVVLLTGASIYLTYRFVPEAEYLPQGNRNLAIGILLPPPGYNIDEISELGEAVETKLQPYFEAEPDSATRGVAEAARKQRHAADENVAPDQSTTRISHFFFVAGESAVFMGAKASAADQASALVPMLRQGVGDLPGMIAVVQQASLFERGIASGRRIDIEITGPNLEQLVQIGGMIFGQTIQRFPFTKGNQARPIPSLDLQTPEVHVIPDRERAKDLGVDARELGITVDAIIDGTKASEYKLNGREVDLRVMGSDQDWDWRTQDLSEIPVHTPKGKLVSLGSLAKIEVTRGPQQINHIERDRAITIQLVPAPDVPLERAVSTIRDEVINPLLGAGLIPNPYSIELAGTADDLSQAYDTFRWSFVLATLITYLLMAALFDSFVYPFVIMFSVPLAAVGGVLCLAVIHSYAPTVRFDILTMLGFVILVGVVVNNAILIVYQTLQSIRGGIARHDAIVNAVATRIRPIFMTMLTSGFGMLPLVIFPGPGSELYRGLGSVVLGGLVISTVFTVLLIPCLLSLILGILSGIGLGADRTSAQPKGAS